MAVDIKQVSRGILDEAFGKGRLEYLDKVCDPGFKGHDPLLGDLDVAGLKGMVEGIRSSFPDLTPTLLGMCAEGDLVCTMWRCTGTYRKPFLGAAPNGQRLVIEGITLDRFRNGKLVESTSHWDTLGFLQGIGLVPRIDVKAAEQRAEHRPGV